MSGDSLGSNDHEEEDDNTDSDEELDSPKRIVQQPQEKMDVDGTESKYNTVISNVHFKYIIMLVIFFKHAVKIT